MVNERNGHGDSLSVNTDARTFDSGHWSDLHGPNPIGEVEKPTMEAGDSEGFPSQNTHPETPGGDNENKPDIVSESMPPLTANDENVSNTPTSNGQKPSYTELVKKYEETVRGGGNLMLSYDSIRPGDGRKAA